MNFFFAFVLLTLVFSTRAGFSATEIDSLPVLSAQNGSHSLTTKPDDYLVKKITRSAKAYRSTDHRELILDNGLIRRTWRLAPNGACIGFDNLMTGDGDSHLLIPKSTSPFLHREWFGMSSNNQENDSSS